MATPNRLTNKTVAHPIIVAPLPQASWDQPLARDGRAQAQDETLRGLRHRFHIYIAEVGTKEGKLYLFVAVDRTSKIAFAKLETEANRYIASAFLRNLIEFVLYETHTVLTDNGQQFCHAPRNRSGPTARCSRHMFDRIRDEHGIEHRLTKPNHP